jgi:hypothetical protein
VDLEFDPAAWRGTIELFLVLDVVTSLVWELLELLEVLVPPMLPAGSARAMAIIASAGKVKRGSKVMAGSSPRCKKENDQRVLRHDKIEHLRIEGVAA